MSESLPAPQPPLSDLTPEVATRILDRVLPSEIDDSVRAVLIELQSGSLTPFDMKVLHEVNRDSDPEYSAALARVMTYWHLWAGNDTH